MSLACINSAQLHYRSKSQSSSTLCDESKHSESIPKFSGYSTEKVNGGFQMVNEVSSNVSSRKFELLSGDSGTEADDENFKKGSIKMGFRFDEPKTIGNFLSSPRSNVPSAEDEKIKFSERTLITSQMRASSLDHDSESMKNFCEIRKLNNIRKSLEIGIIIFILGLLCTDERVRQIIYFWLRELSYLCVILLILTVSHDRKILNQRKSYQSEIRSTQFTVSITNDIAPILYPPLLSILVSLIVFKNQPYDFGSSIILAVASIPTSLVPSFDGLHDLNITHWILSLIPLFWKKTTYGNIHFSLDNTSVNLETLALLSPLNQSLCLTLACFTSASLLPTELQLLSVSLSNLLLHARSPQAIILKSLLWGGGISILVSCRHVLKWSMVLSRTPKWRFRHTKKKISSAKIYSNNDRNTLPVRMQEVIGTVKNNNTKDSDNVNGLIKVLADPSVIPRSRSLGSLRTNIEINPALIMRPTSDVLKSLPIEYKTKFHKNKRRKFRSIRSIPRASKKFLLSDRRKKKPSLSEKSLYTLSLKQAIIRKWLYAGYVYFCIFMIILAAIRKYVEIFALSGSEPFGWALGYLFSDLQIFRNFVHSRSLQHWIRILPQPYLGFSILEYRGLVECFRLEYIGEANTRLIITCYWLIISIIGLTIVLLLFPYFEVDTRRKFYHFLIVTVLLPVTFIDPTFTALALNLVLAIFLLLELFRSTRLPPLSKPLAKFLTPFVDGRDVKGPVVVSHIFLLIGSAIPFWLTLSSLPRLNSTYLDGWNIETRELSMVAGVICVGIGDASASLIGRKYGRRKWLWGGDKSLEGSIAFAGTVTLGLIVSKIWLRLGGWQVNNNDTYSMTVLKSGIAACVASVAEAAIIGVNDNVIVPIILWLCVKGLNI
ncbi:putative phosphatidate cytidylyltransferase [Erysiphe neolycopersici]|uniref:dolichol kinase n=1 Tax=Erysiphe neolycopersici TaxID=212602 RepID=A0A420I0X8_9PEZI|nr:putative phosphatidate cytidylyltransferase [Erysiphe neolycopersici]